MRPRLHTTCETIILNNLACMVARFQHANSGVIDMKFDIRTGVDFARLGGRDPVRGADVIYSWIQGRGLEAAAGHWNWLEQVRNGTRQPQTGELQQGLVDMMRRTADNMECLRQRNHGRLSFMMSAAGEPLRVGPDGRLAPLGDMPEEPGFVDIFYGKGLLACGACLGDASLHAAGLAHLEWALGEIARGRFVSDQQPMDPKNPVTHDPQRLSHAPYMISLGALCLLMQCTADRRWLDRCIQFVEHILQHHVVGEPAEGLQQWDFLEFIRPDGRPYEVEGAVPCDPGHTLEFVGLAGKAACTAAAVFGNDATAAFRRRCQVCLPGVFARAFSLGYQVPLQGICKSVDLRSGRPLNSDMPWWSLPETMRAAAVLHHLFPGDEDVRAAAAATLETSLKALVDTYVNREVHWMAYQTRDGSGNVADVIPACPDVDPCYHTGLSLIDVLRFTSG